MAHEMFSDRFVSLRKAVELRETRRDDLPPSVDPQRLTIGLKEARALLDIYDAAREAAEWHRGQSHKHITDVWLIEAVTWIPKEVPGWVAGGFDGFRGMDVG